MESKIHPIEYSSFEIKKIIADLRGRYPFSEWTPIGKTVAGRDIPALIIGTGTDYTVLQSGADPAFRLGTLLLLRFAEELCQSVITGRELCGVNIRKAMFRRGVIILPTLNPDGVEIAQRGEIGCGYMSGKISQMCGGEYSKWRANLRGVELAGNFKGNFEQLTQRDTGFENSGQPNFCGFYGYRPESEPETVALANLIHKKPTRGFLELAAPGNSVWYGGGETPPPGSAKMAQVLASVAGFSVTPPVGRSGAEICDYYARETGQPGFCVKLGEKQNIPQVSGLNSWYARLREALVLFSLI